MSFFTQTGRFLKCTTVLGTDKFVATQFSSEEALSKLFEHEFKLLSSEQDIDPDKLLHTKISLEIHHGASEPRYFHGIINSFRAGTVKKGMREYEITAIPHVGFLKHETNYRIFQEKNSLEIFEEICNEHHIYDFETKGVKGDISKGELPPKRAQCTQFDETTWDFLARILAEDGIFFFFKHMKDKHIMVLADQPSIHTPCPEPEITYNPDNVRGERHQIRAWEKERQFYSGKYVHCDYNFEKPTESLHTTHETPAALPKAKDYETYQYHGGHLEFQRGKTLATHRFEATQLQYHVIRGESTHTGFAAGSTFELSHHPHPKEVGKYILLEVRHTAKDESYLSGTSEAKKISQEYENAFSCIPKKVPYRAQLLSKPKVTSPQTAFVVGSGDMKDGTIFTDKYGRILVQFHWQWRGNDKLKGEPDTTWVRVAHSWAGKGYGTFFLPRIGQEVVVQFIDGDPDQPLVTGCVYNAHYMPPFPLPENKTQSGIRTRTLGGRVNNENILRFEDKKDSEEIYIHAEKDFNQKIKHDLTITVANDYIHETKHDEIHTIKHDLTHNTGNDVNIDVGNNVVKTIGEKLDIEIGNKAIIEANYSITFKVGTSTIELQPDHVIINGEDIFLNDKLIASLNKLPRGGKKHGK